MKSNLTQAEIEAELNGLLLIDPDLRKIAKVAGTLPIRTQEPGFQSLVHIIIGQLVSRAAAEAIYARFLQQINPSTPEQYLKVGEQAHSIIGLSKTKHKTIQRVASALLEGSLKLKKLSSMPEQKAIDELVAIKGIGRWTAEVYLLFCEGHPDIFPAGDLALREAVRHGLKLENRPCEKELVQIAKRWAPKRGIAAQLFWRYYAATKGGRESQPL